METISFFLDLNASMYKFNDGYKDFRDQLNAIGLMIREMPGDGLVFSVK